MPTGSAHRDRVAFATVAEPLIVCAHAQTPEAVLAPNVIAADDLEKCRMLGVVIRISVTSN